MKTVAPGGLDMAFAGFYLGGYREHLLTFLWAQAWNF